MIINISLKLADQPSTTESDEIDPTTPKPVETTTKVDDIIIVTTENDKIESTTAESTTKGSEICLY